MSRVILFRAFDTFSQRMVSDPYMFEPTQEHHSETAPFIYYETWRDVEDGISRPCHVMQFICLYDKKGVEIFEGDLVKAKRGNTSLGDMNDIYQIVWHEQYACYCYLCVKSDNKYRVGKIAEGRTHPFFIAPNITEIIGNIYQNHELLTP